MKEIGIVILAAGASTRMGAAKQLLEWRGQSLLKRAIEVAQESELGPVMVVLGANHQLILDQLEDTEFDWVENTNWSTGMGSSVHAGLSALLTTHPNLEAVLFLLVDQPLIQVNHLQKLAQTWMSQGTPVVSAQYRGSNGVPALFDHQLFPELLVLSGEKGAKALLHRYAGQLASVQMPAAALDIDTPEAWATFLKDHADS